MSSVMDRPNSPETSPPQGKIARLVAEYGPLVLIVYLSISAVTIVTFAWAIERGFGSAIDGFTSKVGSWIPWLSDEGDVTGTVGTWAAAWVGLKLVQPLRIAATIAITALLHRVWRDRAARKGS